MVVHVCNQQGRLKAKAECCQEFKANQEYIILIVVIAIISSEFFSTSVVKNLSILDKQFSRSDKPPKDVKINSSPSASQILTSI